MTTATATTTETTKRCDAKQVKVGTVFTRFSSGKVVVVSPGGQFRVRNATGFEWNISPDIFEQEFSVADQVATDTKVSRTEVIEVLNAHPRTAMTVNFNKAPDPKAIADALRLGQDKMTDRAWRTKVGELVAGEERTMVGHHYGFYDEHKRLQFQEEEKGQRLVDPRSINWLIVNQVKYTVK